MLLPLIGVLVCLVIGTKERHVYDAHLMEQLMELKMAGIGHGYAYADHAPHEAAIKSSPMGQDFLERYGGYYAHKPIVFIH